jgi:phage terminase Nu1 subunit (DNA packaging protein)
MRLVAEYRLYADKCRELAAKTSRPEFKEKLEAMARAWVTVASELEDQALKQIDRRTGVDSST